MCVPPRAAAAAALGEALVLLLVVAAPFRDLGAYPFVGLWAVLHHDLGVAVGAVVVFPHTVVRQARVRLWVHGVLVLGLEEPAVAAVRVAVVVRGELL